MWLKKKLLGYDQRMLSMNCIYMINVMIQVIKMMSILVKKNEALDEIIAFYGDNMSVGTGEDDWTMSTSPYYDDHYP